MDRHSSADASEPLRWRRAKAIEARGIDLSRRIRKPDIRQQLWSLILNMPNNVAIGRGPYTSTHGPSVWTGRALQAENDDLEMIGLALLYPARKERLCSWPSWIIRARSISFASRPRRPEGPPDHERAGETFSPSPHSDSQTSAGKPIIAFGISLSRPLGATVARSPNRASDGGDRGRRPSPW